MLHPFDAIKNPVNSRHPVYRSYKKLYQHKNRYTVGEDIIVIAFYHYVNGMRSYNNIGYYLRRCSEQTISSDEILCEFDRLIILEKFDCYFRVEGFKAVSKRDRQAYFVNEVPHISVYHNSFPQVYFDWKPIQGMTNRPYVDFCYAFEIAKFSSNRFRKVIAAAKLLKNKF